MLKRITYLQRRDDIERGEFRRHWRQDHAEIARDLPRVVAYRQNHVLGEVFSSVDADSYRIDGIVELWFSDAQAFAAGFGSDVADRLVQDEPKFLQGLTGAAVFSGDPPPLAGGKIWLLANLGPSGLAAVESRVVPRLEGLAGVIEVQVNRLDERSEWLTRSALTSQQVLPNLVVSVSFAAQSDARSAVPSVANIVASQSATLTQARVLLVDEEVVI